MSQFTRKAGIYKGIVIDTDDPAGLNRIKVRILDIHGVMNTNVYSSLKYNTGKEVFWVDDDHLPWAEVCYPYGEIITPEINQVVWVVFYGADSQYPVVIGWAGYEYTYEEEPYVVPK